MRLLTMNTHSLLEENYQWKLEHFVEVVIKERPDILSLQEVNQSIGAKPAGEGLLEGWFPCPAEGVAVSGIGGAVESCRRQEGGGGGIRIREDNHAAQVAFRLRQAGIPCSWTWVPAKIGYGKYDEGLAFLCLNRKIRAAESQYLSGCRDYSNWKTRKTLGIQAEGLSHWFYAVHMGWWQDEEEPFWEQWNRLEHALSAKKQKSPIWLMGDFNSPAEFRGQGYDCIQNAGWLDTYCLAQEKDSGITVEGCIDGWRSQQKGQEAQNGMRIDHIWCSQSLPIEKTQVLFNGQHGQVISDHYALMVKVALSENKKCYSL